MAKQLKYYEVLELIESVDAPSAVKLLLYVAYRHHNFKKGCAWVKQANVADRTGLSLRAVERAFAWAFKNGVLAKRRVMTGKHPSEQYNEYWIDFNRLKELQNARPNGGSSEVSPAKAKGITRPNGGYSGVSPACMAVVEKHITRPNDGEGSSSHEEELGDAILKKEKEENESSQIKSSHGDSTGLDGS